MLLTQQPLVRFSAVPNFFLTLLRFIDDMAKNSGQRLDNVNQTHLVLASGKLVLQKSIGPGPGHETGSRQHRVDPVLTL